MARETGQARKGNTTLADIVSPWERRAHGGLYYTRSRKVNGRVIREYVGGGPLGHLAARLDAEERRKRQQEAAAWKEERERVEALSTPVEELCEAAETFARAVLLTAGYHRHNRGGWRKRREKEDH